MKNRILHRSPLARVRGLGSAKTGTEHFWLQRVTALALIPLGIGFVLYLLTFVGADYHTVRKALGFPVAGLAGMLLCIAAFWHLKLGAQVVIEDYIHHEATKIVSLLLLSFGCFAGGLVCVIALLKLIFGR